MIEIAIRVQAALALVRIVFFGRKEEQEDGHGR